MKILIDIGHPAHVHLFKNLIQTLQEKGHIIFVTVKDIPVAIQLLERHKIDYIKIGAKSDSIISKGINQLKFNIKLYNLLKKHNIDFAIGGITVAHAAMFTKTVSFLVDDDDDEVQPLMTKYGHPFANFVISPDVLKGKRKKKNTIFYSGYHELAYLHPKRFQPDPKVLAELGLKTEEPYFILRFNAFKAHHDLGIEGIPIENKRALVDFLSKKGKVFITTEKNIDEEFKPYQLKISPEKAHSLLYYATMLIGDSQTMTSEAAILGTPSIRSNSFVGRISYLEEEEQKYGLTYGFKPNQFDQMIAKINELLSIPDLKNEWQNRRNRMLKDKIDVTEFFAWLIENFPNSITKINTSPLT